jgi:hypothetical protein
MDETGEQVHDVEGRQLPHGHVLVLQCRLHEVAEVFGRRLVM